MSRPEVCNSKRRAPAGSCPLCAVSETAARHGHRPGVQAAPRPEQDHLPAAHADGERHLNFF